MATPETPKGPFTPGELLRQLREERKINSAREMARRTGLSHTLHSEQEKALGPINMQDDTLAPTPAGLTCSSGHGPGRFLSITFAGFSVSLLERLALFPRGNV